MLFKLKEDSLQMVLIVHHKVVFTPAFHLMHIKHMLALKDIFSVQIIYKSWFFSLCVAHISIYMSTHDDWLLSFETTTTSKLNLERVALSFESKCKKKPFQLVLFLQQTTVKCPRKSLVTAHYSFGPGKYWESWRVLRETQLRAW